MEDFPENGCCPLLLDLLKFRVFNKPGPLLVDPHHVKLWTEFALMHPLVYQIIPLEDTRKPHSLQAPVSFLQKENKSDRIRRAQHIGMTSGAFATHQTDKMF